MFNIPVAIPPTLSRTYFILRVSMWVLVVITGIFLFLAFLFPNFDYSFNFRTPNSSRNSLADPRVSDSTPRTNGRLGSQESITLDAGAFGDFSLARITATLENKSDLPESFTASIKRTYRAFLFPTGPALDTFPREDLFRTEDSFYALRNGTMIPFVSREAYDSRYPESFASEVSKDFLAPYPISTDFIGFRVGTLVSFAEGVFLVTSESDIRPIGSADIFLNLGYDFKNVIPASEEDIGIYKRGRIIALGAVHPSGTLFEDADSGTLYMIEGKTKRPITDPTYRDFLLQKQRPILASESKSNATTECTLHTSFFPRTFSCTVPLDPLFGSPGSNYELTLSHPDADIDINTLSLSLETRKSGENVRTLLSQIKQRILNRFGGR